MIIPLTVNVRFSITLDPSVWIFDDRKIQFEEAFTKDRKEEKDETEDLKNTARLWDQEFVYPTKMKPPVNRTLTKEEREKALIHSFVMPMIDFYNHAEVNEDAKDVTLVTNHGDVKISLEQLKNAYLLFSIKGKPVKEDGPVHLYFGDGSNKDNPIKGIKKIIIN